MLNKNKIRLMTRLAVYDKKFGASDKKKSEYFKWDYIYFRNFRTRLGVFLGCFIIAVLYELKLILVDQVDILAVDLKYEATKLVFFTLVALVVYTVIGTAVAKNEYKKSRERLRAYFSMLDKLDRLNNEDNQGLADYAEAGDNEGGRVFREPSYRAAHKVAEEYDKPPDYDEYPVERERPIREKQHTRPAVEREARTSTFSGVSSREELLEKLKEIRRSVERGDDN